MQYLISLETYKAHNKLLEKYQKDYASSVDLRDIHRDYNSIILHKIYFQIISEPTSFTIDSLFNRAIKDEFGSVESCIENAFSWAMRLGSQGWVILGYDLVYKKLRLDTQWDHECGSLFFAPIIPLDCYEHAYFIDYGEDKESYFRRFFDVINWNRAEELFNYYKKIPLHLEMHL